MNRPIAMALSHNDCLQRQVYNKKGDFLMKLKMITAALIFSAASTGVFAADAATSPAAAPALNSDLQKFSYSVGVDLGRTLHKQGIEIDAAIMAKGLEDGLNNKQFLMTDGQMKEVLETFQKALMEKRSAELNKAATENQKAGDAFLSENKKKEGVVTLPSGLQYKILEKGAGEKPGKDDMVTVEYTGRLLNGETFDSTEKNGQPASFKLSQVIPGWTEVLQLMPVGSTWEVYIPANLAYGARAAGPIGPNSTLIFNIHLLSTKKATS